MQHEAAHPFKHGGLLAGDVKDLLVEPKQYDRGRRPKGTSGQWLHERILLPPSHLGQPSMPPNLQCHADIAVQKVS